MTFVHVTMEGIILPEPYPCTRPVLSCSTPVHHVHNNTVPSLCGSELRRYLSNCRSTGTWQSQDLAPGNLVQDSLLSVLHRISRGCSHAWHFSALGPQLVNWQMRKSFGQTMKPFPWVYPTERINAVIINNRIRASAGHLLQVRPTLTIQSMSNRGWVPLLLFLSCWHEADVYWVLQKCGISMAGPFCPLRWFLLVLLVVFFPNSSFLSL